MFFLTYINREERLSGWFSEYGSFCHHIMEEFFAGKLETWDLRQYYEDHYQEFVVTPPPPFPATMAQNYYDAGLDFFDNFEFDRENYEVISIEDSLFTKYKEINLIVKPDLVLRNKKTNNLVLLDYKTAKFKEGKAGQEKLDGYAKQLRIYSYFLWLERGLEINKIFLWFIRDNKFGEVEIDQFEVQKCLDWIEETVMRIKTEEEWKPNLDKKNEYFCYNLCSVRNACKYRNGEIV
jgi:CRISPR/Cas system-associated exonuclease Cas4 (RecB family)